ncbi:MAG: ribonuclease PH [Candidatus Aminicenantes bacterium]|nr:ribonuclease PH [Candidatus Aminicenantes bacterium]
MREDNRKDSELRDIKIIPDYIQNLPGSVLIEQGNTRIISTATFESKTPHFLKETKKGWINAEYSMLPGSVGNQRLKRERFRTHNRHIEIQRFIGRALRNTFTLSAIEGKSIFIDTDVIQADGSTRCVALNAGMLVTVMVLKHLVFENLIPEMPEIEMISAVSIGLKDKNILVDISYQEDSSADADINIVSTEKQNIIEIQAFAEENPINNKLFKKAIDLGIEKNLEIIQILKKYL